MESSYRQLNAAGSFGRQNIVAGFLQAACVPRKTGPVL